MQEGVTVFEEKHFYAEDTSAPETADSLFSESSGLLLDSGGDARGGVDELADVVFVDYFYGGIAHARSVLFSGHHHGELFGERDPFLGVEGARGGERGDCGGDGGGGGDNMVAAAVVGESAGFEHEWVGELFADGFERGGGVGWDCE